MDCTIYNCNPYTSVQANVPWITTQMYDLNSGGCYISVAENTTSFGRDGVVDLLCNGQVVDCLYVIQEAGAGNSDPGDDPGEQEFGAPTGLSLSKSGYMVTLTWNKVPKAIKYWIYHSNPTAYDSGYFATTKSTSSTTITMDCSIAGNWAFKVVAYNGSNYSDFSNTVSTFISESDINGGGGGDTQKPSVPTGLSAVQSGETIVVSWNAVSNAYYYRLWYSTPSGQEDFTNVYAPSTSAVFDRNMKDGTYRFWIQALNSNYDESAKSSKVSCTFKSNGGGNTGGDDKPSKLDTPKNLEAYSGGSFVQISFDEVSLAYQYELYRSTSATSGYSKISASGGSTSGNRYVLTDSNPKSGTTYYKVKAKALSYLGIADSDFSAYVKVTR